MPAARKLALIWLIFVVRGLFYISALPMWEGFDEWAHYAAVQSTAVTGRALLPRNETVSREVQTSLELVPIPWQTHGPPNASRHEDYWKLPESDRREREQKLRSIPIASTQEQAPEGERSYEAQQAPLYYWIAAPVYRVTSGLSLPSRVWVLRLFTLLIGSLIVPLGYTIGRTVLAGRTAGLMVAALLTATPQLMMTVSHIANDSLAVVLGGLVTLAALRWMERPQDTGRTVAAGIAAGTALLTKAYFLALIPPLCLAALTVAWRKRAYVQAGLLFVSVAAISAWWYWRNWTLTHSLSGEQVEAGSGLPGTNLTGFAHMDWLRAADFTFLSHVWLGNWSFLVVRSWMYRIIALLMLIALAMLIIRLIRRPNHGLLLLSGIYVTFLAALAYHALRNYQNGGFGSVLGYYLFGIAAVEATLLVAGLGRATPILIVSLAALEFFGTTFLLAPYYTGAIAHLPNGNLPALSLKSATVSLVTGLTVNKPPFLTSTVIAVLWILSLAATVGVIFIAIKTATPAPSTDP